MKLTRKSRGFTLIELLTVIAIIGILAALLVPTVGVVRKTVAKTQMKARFGGWSTGYTLFKAEYKFYPTMGAQGAVFKISENNDVFVETLLGKKRNGDPVSTDYAKRANKKRLQFYDFPEAEFAGADSTAEEGKLVDTFGNTNIVVVIDRDLNGLIEESDLPDNPDGDNWDDIRAGVIFYSDPQENPDFEWIFSW